ncbi:MAG: hypothetical protein ACYTEZ_01675 [Planctomycetota bacterium]
MRLAGLACVLCAACATTIRDLPPEKLPAGARAMLAGRLDFAGTRIDSTLRLRSLQGHELVVRPTHATFLVEVPPGTYEVQRFGSYAPRDDRLTLEAKRGKARYVGSFRAARDAYGDLRVVVRDEMWPVAEELVDRYGPALPQVEPGLVRSSLPPIEGTDKELVIALQRVESSAWPIFFSLGLGFYYGYDGGHGHSGHSRRSSASRPSHRSRGSRHAAGSGRR